MNIIEAALALKEGKSVRRAHWPDDWEDVAVDDLPDEECPVLEDGTFVISLGDMLATDWEIVQ